MQYFEYPSKEFDVVFDRASNGSVPDMIAAALSVRMSGVFDNYTSQKQANEFVEYWLNQAAMTGDLPSMRLLVDFYSNPRTLPQMRNDKKRNRWLVELASKGDDEATFELGLHAMNRGNWIAGQEWYLRAARRRHTPSINALMELGASHGHESVASGWMEYLLDAGMEFPDHLKLIPGGGDEPDDEQDIDEDNYFDSEGRPKSRLIRTPKDAEVVACEWMQFFGFADADVTSDGSDGGIDVDSEGAIAQVKFKGVQTGRPEIQQLFGIASHQKKAAFFFSLGDFTSAAISFADEAGVALFRFDLQGTPVPRNDFATWFLQAEIEEEQEDIESESGEDSTVETDDDSL